MDRIGSPQPSSISVRALGSGAVGVSIRPQPDNCSAGSPWLNGPGAKPFQHRDMIRVPAIVSQRYTSQWCSCPTSANSSLIVGDPVNTFHDPWHVDHFKPGSKPFKVYTPGGMEAIERNLKITTPPIYLTGLLEFELVLKRNISEAYTSDKTAKAVVKDTEEEWKRSIRRIGKRRLKEELASYKSLFPSIDSA